MEALLAGEMLIVMLNTCVERLDTPELLVPILRASGRRHAAYHVERQHFDSVGAALLWTLETLLGSAWTPEAKAAWTWLYGVIVEYVARCVDVVSM